MQNLILVYNKQIYNNVTDLQIQYYVFIVNNIKFQQKHIIIQHILKHCNIPPYKMPRQSWISDTSNKRVKQIKQSFQSALGQQSKQSRINYYDFLLVAKKLSFRFEQSSHLMSLKNFFTKNKNSILIKKLVDTLCINQQSLNTKDEKIIVKFNVPDNDFAPIKQVTNQDQQQYYHGNIQQDQQQTNGKFQKVGSLITIDQNNQEINEKMTIILSIKLEQMQKKIKLLINQFHYPNIFTVFDDHTQQQLNYFIFRNGILKIIADIKDKIKISEDDIKTLFFILDQGQKGYITLENIQKLKNIQETIEHMKNFYHSRINRDMVKNTLFKLGKVKNSSIQIYQLKNASVLEFQQLQEQIVNQPIIRQTSKKRIPHFGPLKGATKWKKGDQHYTSTDLKYPHHSQSQTLGSKKGNLIDKQRQRIQKILRNSKQDKKKQKGGQTVASKLRSLFIHKVILPREKMLEQQKQKYGRGNQGQYQLSIRPLKETR